MSEERKAASPDTGSEPAGGRFSRRRFLKGVALSAGAAAVPAEGLLGRVAGAAPEAPSPIGPAAAPVALTVNGKEVKLKVEPRVTLLDALRDHLDASGTRHLDLTGTKRVCDRGSCGACTVVIDGRTAYSCSILAVEAQGKKIETIEGLETGGQPHPLQEAFVHTDGLMCGFCTPGFVMASKALLDSNPYPTHEEICRGLNGNICRCGTYIRVFEAVKRASEEMRAQKGG
jgi:xanthine dehydrogenase YagT iron-sulfur-binding subunit